MTEDIKYTCSCCGKEHFEWPALAFTSPDYYDQLSQDDKEQIAELDSDFCVIRHPDQMDRFIRCTLTQKVNDHCEDLEYGLWVSLSEKSFDNYCENYDNDNHEASYFGWLCNEVPGYEFKEGIPTTVFTRTGNQRPEIVPHKDFDHPFVRDYYSGISKKEAERRIKEMLGRIEMADETTSNKKPWWKFWSFLFIISTLTGCNTTRNIYTSSSSKKNYISIDVQTLSRCQSLHRCWQRQTTTSSCHLIVLTKRFSQLSIQQSPDLCIQCEGRSTKAS